MSLRNIWLHSRVFSGCLVTVLVVVAMVATLWLLFLDELVPAVVCCGVGLFLLFLGMSSMKWMSSFMAASVACRKGKFDEAAKHLLQARSRAERFSEGDPRPPMGQPTLGDRTRPRLNSRPLGIS